MYLGTVMVFPEKQINLHLIVLAYGKKEGQTSRAVTRTKEWDRQTTSSLKSSSPRGGSESSFIYMALQGPFSVNSMYTGQVFKDALTRPAIIPQHLSFPPRYRLEPPKQYAIAAHTL